METTTKRMLKHVVAGACAVLLAGAAQAALLDRDLNGDTVVDAFYDTDLEITWLRDANVNGPMEWATAMGWAEAFSFGGYSDWRLPTSDNCDGYCSGSEMGHLWYVELGNPAGGPMTNTGDFQSLAMGVYFSSTLDPRYGAPRAFNTITGFQAADDPMNSRFAFAVRDGDVAAIPEPETYALMLVGLAGLAFATWRRSR